MNQKTCLIYQPCGLGDILFLQKIAHMMNKDGYKVVHPVVHEYEWLNHYLINKDFSFPSWGDKERKINGPPLPDNIGFPHKDKYWPDRQDFFSEDFVFLNFFLPFSGPVMASKYSKLNIGFSDWSDYISLSFARKSDKEKELFYDHLGLKDGEEYVFINRNYQIRPDVRTFNRISSNPNDYDGKKVVELTINQNFTVFDWSIVLEKAKEIHMIETSLNYIIESDLVNLDSERQKLCLYSRHGWFGEVDYLFKTKWNYMRGIT